MRCLAIVAAFATAATAATIDVIVGMGGGLNFTPPAISALVGDKIQFTFVAKNHTVTQSTFATPCANMTGGVDSGFQGPGTNTSPTSFTQWSFTVTATTPLWFYCRQANHCQQGMVFAVNPTAEKSFSAFQQMAMGQTPTSGGGNQTSPSSAKSLSAFNSAAALGIAGVMAGLML